jgi:hypothetical protein
MPQETTSSEAGPGTKIIYCTIIHICLWWNLYMGMDNSLVHFIRVAGGTFRRWIYPDNPPASSLIFKWYRCSSSLPLIGRRAGTWLGDTGPDWAIRGGGTGVCDSDSFLNSVVLHIVIDTDSVLPVFHSRKSPCSIRRLSRKKRTYLSRFVSLYLASPDSDQKVCKMLKLYI